MGHIGYKLLSGFIKDFHTVDHLVECICDQLCLRIVRNTDFFIQHAICQVFNGLRHSCKWFYKYCREQPCQKYRKNNNTSDQHHASLFHLCQCFRNINSRNTYQHHALKLLHAKTGAAVARDIFGVKDAVYEAIRWHTTGKPDMTLLEKVIYLADYIEPNRDFPGVDELRRAVYDDLDKGLLMGLSDTIDEMERMGNPVHHDTLEARDFLLRGEAK